MSWMRTQILLILPTLSALPASVCVVHPCVPNTLLARLPLADPGEQKMRLCARDASRCRRGMPALEDVLLLQL
jgi:hypothetical protein